MSTSGSDSDLDGFTLEEASEAVARSANLVRSVPDEYDVDISDDDTECYFDSDRGEDDLSDDDIAAPDNLNAEWTDELSDMNLQQFREECGPTHALPADARPLDYFLLTPCCSCRGFSLKWSQPKRTGTPSRRWQTRETIQDGGTLHLKKSVRFSVSTS